MFHLHCYGRLTTSSCYTLPIHYCSLLTRGLYSEERGHEPDTIVVMSPETTTPSFVAPLVGLADAVPYADQAETLVRLLGTVTLADRVRSAHYCDSQEVIEIT